MSKDLDQSLLFVDIFSEIQMTLAIVLISGDLNWGENLETN